jgi:hypothetical protein
MTANNALEKLRNNSVVASIKVVTQHLLGESEENHEELQSEKPTSGRRIELRAFLMRIRIAYPSTSMFAIKKGKFSKLQNNFGREN